MKIVDSIKGLIKAIVLLSIINFVFIVMFWDTIVALQWYILRIMPIIIIIINIRTIKGILGGLIGFYLFVSLFAFEGYILKNGPLNALVGHPSLESLVAAIVATIVIMVIGFLTGPIDTPNYGRAPDRWIREDHYDADGNYTGHSDTAIFDDD